MFETGIRPAIDEYLAKKRAEIRDYGDYWSASSAGYCMRKVYMERAKIPNVQKDDDERKTRVFEAGHIFHQWLQGITKDSGLSIAQEIELQDEKLMIRGHVDDLVLVDDKLLLYDYKTAHSKSFDYAKGRPMSHYHRMQVGTYMYLLREGAAAPKEDDDFYAKAEITELKEARVMSISKDDLRMLEKELVWTSGLELEIMDYWRTLNEYWKVQELPPCTCADQEGGFMANEKYNPFWYKGEPCSEEWYKLNKEKQDATTE